MARSKRPLYIPLFPADFMGDPNVRSMTNTQVGIYMILIMTAWQETPPCTLPNDDEVLARWALCKNIREWNRLSPPVMACWTLIDGRWINKRLRREFDGRVEAADRAAKKGKSGADKRWNPPLPDDACAMPVPFENDGKPAIVLPMPSDGSRIPYPVSRVLIQTSSAAADTIPREGEREGEPEPSLSGIKLTWKEQSASDQIFAAASDAMRPKGSAGKNWVLPLHAAERICAAIDSMLKAGPAVIDGSEQHPCEFAGEISAVVRGANPAGLGPFCNFITSIWERCQRNGCKPGDPHKSNPLKIERQKPNDAAETDTAMAAIAAEIEKQELRRARR